jgi:hypothetical protein
MTLTQHLPHSAVIGVYTLATQQPSPQHCELLRWRNVCEVIGVAESVREENFFFCLLTLLAPALCNR